MKQIQKIKTGKVKTPSPVDTRTPSGRKLPY